MVSHEPHQLSITTKPPDFQNQGASSSNYQVNTRQLGFHELLLVMNDTRITQLENGQVDMGCLMKNMENIQSTMGKLA